MVNQSLGELCLCRVAQCPSQQGLLHRTQGFGLACPVPCGFCSTAEMTRAAGTPATAGYSGRRAVIFRQVHGFPRQRGGKPGSSQVFPGGTGSSTVWVAVLFPVLPASLGCLYRSQPGGFAGTSDVVAGRGHRRVSQHQQCSRSACARSKLQLCARESRTLYRLRAPEGHAAHKKIRSFLLHRKSQAMGVGFQLWIACKDFGVGNRQTLLLQGRNGITVS